MSVQKLVSLLKETPLIASLCREEDLDDLLTSNVRLAFVMCGDLRTLPGIVEQIRGHKIHPFINIDFIEGLSAKDSALDFIKYYTCAEGIVTTKSGHVRRARSLGLYAVQRYFVFDNISKINIKKQLESSPADFVEILPGVITSVVTYMADNLQKPLLVGGLVDTKEDIRHALSAGAKGITTSIPNLWYLSGDLSTP